MLQRSGQSSLAITYSQQGRGAGQRAGLSCRGTEGGRLFQKRSKGSEGGLGQEEKPSFCVFKTTAILQNRKRTFRREGDLRRGKGKEGWEQTENDEKRRKNGNKAL